MTSTVIEKIRKNIQPIGGSHGIVLPSKWLEELGVKPGNEVTLGLMYSDKHNNKFVAIWNSLEQSEFSEEL